MGQKHVGLKLFIEGTAVHIQSARRIVTGGRPTDCTVVIPPVKSGMRIIPGSLIHVFVFDNGYWRLFFEGIYVKRSFVNKVDQDSIVLGCISYGKYFQELRAKFLSVGQDVAYKEQAFVGFRPDQSHLGISISSQSPLFTPYYAFASKLASNGIGATVFETMKKMQDFGKIWQRDERTIKLTKRIVYAENPAIQKILIRENTINALLNIAQSMSSRATLSDMISLFFPLSLFNYTEIPSPKYTDVAFSDDIVNVPGGLGQIVYKPHTFYAAPPRCNLIFKNQYANFEFSTDYRTEPTRFSMASSLSPLIGDRKYTTRRYYAPGAIADSIGTITANGVGAYNQKPLKDILTTEELYRGIIPYFGQAPFSESVAAVIGKQGAESLHDIFQNYSQYMFYLQKYQNRFLTLSSDLDLNLAVGFPATVIHNLHTVITGELMQTVDVIDVNGANQSSVTIGYCRYIDFDDGDAAMVDADHYLEVFGEKDQSDAPAFFDEAYKDASIGDRIYQPLLGCNSIIESGENLTSALARITKRFETAADRHSFTSKYKAREVATEGEVMVNALDARKTVTLYKPRKNPTDPQEEIPDREYALKLWGGDKGVYEFDSENDLGMPFMRQRQDRSKQLVAQLKASHFAMEG